MRPGWRSVVEVFLHSRHTKIFLMSICVRNRENWLTKNQKQHHLGSAASFTISFFFFSTYLVLINVCILILACSKLSQQETGHADVTQFLTGEKTLNFLCTAHHFNNSIKLKIATVSLLAQRLHWWCRSFINLTWSLIKYNFSNQTISIIHQT